MPRTTMPRTPSVPELPFPRPGEIIALLRGIPVIVAERAPNGDLRFPCQWCSTKRLIPGAGRHQPRRPVIHAHGYGGDLELRGAHCTDASSPMRRRDYYLLIADVAS